MLSSTALKLPDGGELVVIWDGGPGLWRWGDGRLLLGNEKRGKITDSPESSTITTKLIDDIVLGWTHKNGYSDRGMWAKRLVARSRDTVELQLLWETKINYRWCNSSVYLPEGKVLNGSLLMNTHTDVKEQDNHIEAISNCVAITSFLVTAIAEIDLIPEHFYFSSFGARKAFRQNACAIAAGIVKYENFRNARPCISLNSGQDRLNCLGSVVGNYKDANFIIGAVSGRHVA